MTSTELNFVILKINDIDCTNLSPDETFQVFLKAEEPIIIKAKKRRAEDKNDKLYLFDGDCMYLLKYQRKPSNDKNELVSVECQTDIQTCCAQNHLVTNTQNEGYRPGLDNQSIFSHCFVPGIDIEEVTLRKAQSDEKLGLTVSYSSVNDSTSTSTSEEGEPDSDDIMEGEEDDCEDNGCGDIYICNILPDSIAARDGRLRQGDQIIQINGKGISSKGETESLFAENKNSITLLVSRCVCTDDEFLDSAIYCDDRDQNTGMSLSLDCEPSTYSSKSSLPSLSEAQKQIPLQMITSFDSNACDHANIRAKLESVNKEISLLNSQISNMKLNKDVSQPPQSPKQALPEIINSPLLQEISFDLAGIYRSEKFTKAMLSSPINQKNKTVETCMTSHSKKLKNDTCNPRRHMLGQPLQPGNSKLVPNTVNIIQQAPKVVRAPEIEHIYETIPEDSDTDSYYCSPYDERKDQNRVEQWLKSQSVKNLVDIGNHCQTSSLKRLDQARIAGTGTEEREIHFNQSNTSRTYGNNSIFEDYENSSSAYNTGDSCASNMLAIEQNFDDKNQSCSTLVYQPYSQQLETYENCNQCQLRYRKLKLTTKHPRKSLNQGDVDNDLISTKGPTHQHGKNLQSKNILGDKDLTKAIKINQKLFRKAVTNTQQNVNELFEKGNIGPVLHQRSLRKNIQVSKGEAQASTTFLEESTKSQSNADENIPMVWKVKRRADGTRYIVRRPVGRPNTSSSTSNQLLQQYSQQLIGHHTSEQNQIICAAAESVVNDEIITITESKKGSPECLKTYTTSIRKMNSWQTQQNDRTKERRHSGQQEQKQRIDKFVDSTAKRSDGNKPRQIQKQWLI